MKTIISVAFVTIIVLAGCGTTGDKTSKKSPQTDNPGLLQIGNRLITIDLNKPDPIKKKKVNWSIDETTTNLGDKIFVWQCKNPFSFGLPLGGCPWATSMEQGAQIPASPACSTHRNTRHLTAFCRPAATIGFSS